MNNVLRLFLHCFILVFFDDILIYSRTWSEHLRHVRIVLQALLDQQLFVKKSKCTFGTQSVTYLGYVIMIDEVAMDEQRDAAVKDWSVPRSVLAMQAFLGLVGYYCRFIHDYGMIAYPLSNLLCKEGFR
jgi:hypothetical protein